MHEVTELTKLELLHRQLSSRGSQLPKSALVRQSLEQSERTQESQRVRAGAERARVRTGEGGGISAAAEAGGRSGGDEREDDEEAHGERGWMRGGRGTGRRRADKGRRAKKVTRE